MPKAERESEKESWREMSRRNASGFFNIGCFISPVTQGCSIRWCTVGRCRWSLVNAQRMKLDAPSET